YGYIFFFSLFFPSSISPYKLPSPLAGEGLGERGRKPLFRTKGERDTSWIMCRDIQRFSISTPLSPCGRGAGGEGEKTSLPSKGITRSRKNNMDQRNFAKGLRKNMT
ncbi:MAG: hypothetical protein ABW107_19900, partial [Candidatus Thiodiazotropha sp. 6PLUC5]